MTLVIDASVAMPAALAGRWSARLAGEHLAAPTLLWSEVASGLRQLEYRGEIDGRLASAALAWLRGAEVDLHSSRDLVVDAHEIASGLGWAKTYDAEYVALARRLDAPLVTLDGQLRRGAQALIAVVQP